MHFEASTAPPPPTLKNIKINPRVHPFILDLALCEDLGFRPSGLDYSAPRAALPQPRPMPFSRLEEWCSGVVRPRGRTQATAGFVPEGEETREGAGGEDFGRWGGPRAGRRRGAGHRSRRPSSAVTETGVHQAPSLRPKRGTRCTPCTPRGQDWLLCQNSGTENAGAVGLAPRGATEKKTGAHQAPSLRPKRGTRCTPCTPCTPRGPGLVVVSEFRDGAVGRAGLSQRDRKKPPVLRIAKFAKICNEDDRRKKKISGAERSRACGPQAAREGLSLGEKSEGIRGKESL